MNYYKDILPKWDNAYKNTENVRGIYGISGQICKCCKENNGERIDGQLLGTEYQTLRKCKNGTYYIVDSRYDN